MNKGGFASALVRLNHITHRIVLFIAQASILAMVAIVTLTVILREHRLTLAPIAVVPVAAAEVGYLPIGKRPDARGELLYKITVVRDEEQRLLIV